MSYICPVESKADRNFRLERIRVPRTYETNPSQDPTVGVCPGPGGGPRGVNVFYEQGTPVARHGALTGSDFALALKG